MDKILGDIPHTFSHLEDILISLKEEHMVDLKSLKPWKTCILGSLLSIRLFTTFRHMVEGRPFILYTDHQNLVPSMVIKTARQMNQLSEIVEDSTDISYLKGKSDFGDWRINAVTMNQLQIHNCRFVPVVLRHLERCFETGTCNRLSTGCECSWLIFVNLLRILHGIKHLLLLCLDVNWWSDSVPSIYEQLGMRLCMHFQLLKGVRSNPCRSFQRASHDSTASILW